MPKPFDATLKGLLERGPADWLALLGSGDRHAEVIDADVSTFTGASDKVIRVKDDPDWLMDVNFQRGPDASVPRRAHVYNGILEYRHDLLVRSVVVLLTPKANLSVIDGRYVRAFSGRPPHIDFRYDVIRVWELPVEPLLDGGFGTLALAPISNIEEGQLPGVLARLKERLSGPQVPPGSQDMWTAAFILMGLRYDRVLIERLARGVLGMEESVTYQAIVEEGIVKGELREARKLLRLFGASLLGEPPADVAAALEAIRDVDRLERLSLAVHQVKSWQELLQVP